MLDVSRRRLFGFGAALLAAPAIVRVASLMPVSVPKLIVAPVRFKSGNTLLSSDIILREALLHLENELIISKICNRDYEREFMLPAGGKMISIRRFHA